MTPELKDRWLDALKSGEYEQTTGSLMTEHDDFQGESYCCLGVLLDIEGCLNVYGDNDLYHSKGMPTEKFLNQVGLDSDYAELLSISNDAHNDFDYVIKMIEKEV